MDKELEKEIERKKKYLADYIKFAEKAGVAKDVQERLTDMLLDDLSKLLKKRK